MRSSEAERAPEAGVTPAPVIAPIVETFIGGLDWPGCWLRVPWRPGPPPDPGRRALFSWAGWVIGLPAGLLAGVLAPAGRFWWAFLGFLAAAVLYGRLCTRLAREGYLRLPEEF